MRSNFIEIKPNNWTIVFGTPLEPGEIAGGRRGQLIFSTYNVAQIDGQFWTGYDYKMGPRKSMEEAVVKLNSGEGVPDKFRGARFAVGASFSYKPGHGLVQYDSSDYFSHTVYINRLPEYNPRDVITYQTI